MASSCQTKSYSRPSRRNGEQLPMTCAPTAQLGASWASISNQPWPRSEYQRIAVSVRFFTARDGRSSRTTRGQLRAGVAWCASFVFHRRCIRSCAPSWLSRQTAERTTEPIAAMRQSGWPQHEFSPASQRNVYAPVSVRQSYGSRVRAQPSFDNWSDTEGAAITFTFSIVCLTAPCCWSA
jgi:hypothetical protein